MRLTILFYEAKMDTPPIDIPLKVNPSFDNPLSKSVIYTFPESSKSVDTQGNLLLRFPYSHNLFWTNFNYYCVGFNTIDIELILITEDGYTYSISPNTERAPRVWHDTIWVLPSINTGKHSGLFLRVKSPADNLKYFRFNLLGFMDLYPDVENYLLMTELKSYQFIFSKYRDENNKEIGTIYNVEHTDYIRSVIDTAQKIWPC
jgi:hypothetical protein